MQVEEYAAKPVKWTMCFLLVDSGLVSRYLPDGVRNLDLDF